MSGHLIGCAGALKTFGPTQVPIPTSHKLALLAFADSADDRTHIGFPGEEGVMKWAVCSRGRAYELIRDLVEWGLLKLHKRGRRGQRAEYIVFPGGCCDLHRPAAEPDSDPDVDAIAAAAGVTPEQARRMLAALADEPEKGSDASDSVSGIVSSAPDANDHIAGLVDPESVDKGVEEPGKGPDSVHGSRSNANAFTPSENSPQPPTASRQGSCAKHPNGHASCRACGTSPRAAAKAAGRAAAAQAREVNQQRIRSQRGVDAAKRVDSKSPEIQKLLRGLEASLDAAKRHADERRAG